MITDDVIFSVTTSADTGISLLGIQESWDAAGQGLEGVGGEGCFAVQALRVHLELGTCRPLWSHLRLRGLGWLDSPSEAPRAGEFGADFLAGWKSAGTDIVRAEGKVKTFRGKGLSKMYI